jgi:hypothetical protein
MRSGDATIAVDNSGLLHLQLSLERATLWSFEVARRPAPVQQAATVDRGRLVVERAATNDFIRAGGASVDCATELNAWRDVFVRRRVTHASKMLRAAIAGTLEDSEAMKGAEELQRVRKKDLPDECDSVGIRRLLTSHSLQQALVAQRAGRHRHRRVLAVATRTISGNRQVWQAPSRQEPLSAERRHAMIEGGGDLEALDRSVRCPRRRVLLDELATPRECALAVGASIVGMDVHDEGAAETGEAVVVASPPSTLRGTLGEGGVRLVAMLCWRVLRALRREFGEDRPLHLAGAMLTRTQPPAGSSEYDYGVAHVDRANMSSYDYSAVLYLNTQGGGFDGGDFAFVDDHEDEVVEPRAGRCVLFASGFEHLHRVGKVTRGSRFVLASWYTLNTSRTAGDALHRAEYAMGEDVAPPAAAEDEEAQGRRLDTLVALAGGTLQDLEALVNSTTT